MEGAGEQGAGYVRADGAVSWVVIYACIAMCPSNMCKYKDVNIGVNSMNA
jgi:hypothetical protein